MSTEAIDLFWSVQGRSDFRLYTWGSDSHLWDKLLISAAFPSRHQSLVSWRVGVTVHIHQEWRGHQVRRLLGLLIQHIVVGVTNEWSVVSVEKHLVCNLKLFITHSNQQHKFESWVLYFLVWILDLAEPQVPEVTTEFAVTYSNIFVPS